MLKAAGQCGGVCGVCEGGCCRRGWPGPRLPGATRDPAQLGRCARCPDEPRAQLLILQGRAAGLWEPGDGGEGGVEDQVSRPASLPLSLRRLGQLGPDPKLPWGLHAGTKRWGLVQEALVQTIPKVDGEAEARGKNGVHGHKGVGSRAESRHWVCRRWLWGPGPLVGAEGQEGKHPGQRSMWVESRKPTELDSLQRNGDWTQPHTSPLQEPPWD